MFQKLKRKEKKCLPYKQRSHLLVDGYIRKEIKSISINILNFPKEIVELVFIFYLLEIAHEMIFDQKNIGKEFELLSNHKIKVKGTQTFYTQLTQKVSSARLCYGISLDKAEYKGITSISWKVKINVFNFPNAMHFIGVVSNRTTNFDGTNPFCPRNLLIDSYGISGNAKSIYHADKSPKDNMYGLMIDDKKYPGYKQGNWITVKYMVNDSILVYENLMGNKTYTVISAYTFQNVFLQCERFCQTIAF